MTVAVIIVLCSLLLLAYVFEISASKTRIPTVILLLLLGGVMRQLLLFFEISLPDFHAMLPILGTIGLILIVLEGSLELELNKSKLPIIRKSIQVAAIPLLVLSFGLAFIFMKLGGFTYKDSLLNAIPFAVISSAIAIPSVRSLTLANREFVTYESSLSDILGVLLFNFIALNQYVSLYSFWIFILQILLIIVVSFVSVSGLSLLLSRIKHHVSYTPVILLVILIYMVSKAYHLPGLIFILVFGLFLGNIDEFNGNKWIQKLHPERLSKEVVKFKEITVEATFLVRTLFFLLFGYLIDPREIFNTETIFWAVGIIALIMAIRAIQLKLSGLLLSPLLFIAPRGLITVLLFLAIEPASNISIVNNSLVIQVIVISALVMMGGLMTGKGRAQT